jgi:uncharacterized protein
VRIYFATDIHGSTKCWLKFLAAARFYGADVLVMGGDITGKLLVPLVRDRKGRLRAEFLGIERKPKNDRAVEELKSQIENTGYYWCELSADDYEQLSHDRSGVDELFKDLVIARVRRWVALAEERLGGDGVRIVVNAGNDDFFEVDDVLSASSLIERPEGRVVRLGDVELIGVGYANLTPWNCPRDIAEDELSERIRAAADSIEDPRRAIFDIHVPPYDTKLDRAPRLDGELRPVMTASGDPEIVPVGSTAVREAILEYRPLLGLHGHIHESPAVDRLGSTTVINPGSEYGEGILRGALVDLTANGTIERTELVIG